MKYTRPGLRFSTPKRVWHLPTVKSFGLSFYWKLVKQPSFNTASKQMFTKCLQFPCAQQGKNGETKSHNFNSKGRSEMQCLLEMIRSQYLGCQDHRFLSMATGRFPLNHDGRKLKKTCQLWSTGSSKNNMICCFYDSIRFPNLKCEHKQSGKQGWHQEPSN